MRSRTSLKSFYDSREAYKRGKVVCLPNFIILFLRNESDKVFIRYLDNVKKYV